MEGLTNSRELRFLSDSRLHGKGAAGTVPAIRVQGAGFHGTPVFFPCGSPRARTSSFHHWPLPTPRGVDVIALTSMAAAPTPYNPLQPPLVDTVRLSPMMLPTPSRLNIRLMR